MRDKRRSCLGIAPSQGPIESPDPWERHISLDTCLIGKTKEFIGIYLKNNVHRVVSRSIWRPN
jgi:hypothetical protein